MACLELEHHSLGSAANQSVGTYDRKARLSQLCTRPVHGVFTIYIVLFVVQGAKSLSM